ncbi:MAG: hypothetical protein Q7U91_00220 [Sideroxyarcus sp.]|nr:hypothetical protein [Sideroxyarcus sp.]
MTAKCKACGKETTLDAPGSIASGICEACASRVSDTSNRDVLEAIDAPILLMQGNPRQVITANTKALGLFGKSLSDVANKRGGQVFDCIHSFTEAGCGKDINCENCKIKEAIVDTFNTGHPHPGVSATLQIKKASGTIPHVLQVSTEKVGDLALVRVERFDNSGCL